LSAEALEPKLRLDCELMLANLDYDFLTSHDALQPFGMGNSQPMFFARGVAPASEPRVLKEKHFSFQLRQNGRQHAAIFFNGAESELPRPPWDIAFRIERNEFENRISVQLQITALRSAVL